MQHTDKAIAEFEAWWDRQPHREQFEDLKQQFCNVAVAFYQKGREDLVVTIDPGDCFSPNDCGDLAIWLDDAKRLFEAAGVTVRG